MIESAIAILVIVIVLYAVAMKINYKIHRKLDEWENGR